MSATIDTAATGPGCLEGLVALVTGSSRGIGAAVARRSESGSVVNVTSIAGFTLTGSSIPYAVSKAAADHLTKLLARTLAPAVRVNAVAPGLVRTTLTDSFPGDYIANYEKGIPLGHGAEPDDIARACLSFARPGFATGTVLAVDGGIQLK
jgi:ketoreductase RED2